MARTKSLNLKIRYGKSGYAVNDLGENKSPRFELYHEPSKAVKAKSNNPYEFDDYILKIWKEEYYNADVQELADCQKD